MKFNFISALVVSLATVSQIHFAAAAEDPGCRVAGPGAEFCTQGAFQRVDTGGVEGLSFWLDQAGYLSKILVQPDAEGAADQTRIEQQILAMVSGQATEIGREFQFSDLSSTSAGGAPFGTISYALAAEGRTQAILHSYVAVKGIVVQVISQIALKGAAADAEALKQAHHRALDAIELTNTDQAL